jgi:hypothetical protein
VSHAEVRVHYAALQVSLLKSGLIDASEALADWAEEWLYIDAEDFDEQLLEPDYSDDVRPSQEEI